MLGQGLGCAAVQCRGLYVVCLHHTHHAVLRARFQVRLHCWLSGRVQQLLYVCKACVCVHTPTCTCADGATACLCVCGACFGLAGGCCVTVCVTYTYIYIHTCTACFRCEWAHSLCVSMLPPYSFPSCETAAVELSSLSGSCETAVCLQGVKLPYHPVHSPCVLVCVCVSG